MQDHDFDIKPGSKVSDAFLAKNITQFSAALFYIKQLPYGRNTDKNNPLIALIEQCGTCGTKHAVLCSLARENGHAQVKLITGMFKMNAGNSPKVAAVLQKHGLHYIPEAHNYLRINGRVVDMTMPGAALDFLPDLIEETEIDPAGISEEKVRLHKQFLQKWLATQDLRYGLEEIWAIREQCIAALAV